MSPLPSDPEGVEVIIVKTTDDEIIVTGNFRDVRRIGAIEFKRCSRLRTTDWRAAW